jgi:hypothetical protein
MITGLEKFFNRPVTKFFLAFLIILSVLPLPEVRSPLISSWKGLYYA